jgi:hypothetical protein
MRNFKIIGMILIIGISAGFISCNILPIIGNGSLVSSKKNVSSFEKVSSGDNSVVRYHASQEYRVVITTDSNLIKIVTTEVSDNTLKIGTSGYYIYTKLVVDVYCPVLTGVSISGSGSFNSDDKITASVFEPTVSGFGSIKYRGTPKIDFNGSGSESGKIGGE